MNLTLYEFALKDERIPSTEKNVLRLIIFRCNAESYTCYFSQEKAAKELGLCRQRLSQAVSWLRKNNYVDTTPKGKILTFDLSSWATRSYDLSFKATSPVVVGDTTCRLGRHRTSIERATNIHVDSRNGMKFKITAEGSRQYL